MQCPKCQQDNRDDARFCRECAAPLTEELACPACGRPYERGQKFCDACAQPLPAVTPSSVARDRATYTPKHLADKILSSRSALEGERKRVTVLFADIKGSMELAEQVDAEQWHGILDRFFTLLTDGVHRFEGTVNQYTGDGIMALFGAPIAHEDHAQRACYAALYLRDQLRRYADDLRLSSGLSFSVRMGMNSGEVIVGKIGDDLRMDYTAQGRTVGLAARMEQLAEPRSIYVAEDTAKLVEGFAQLRDLGVSRVKGAQEGLHVYELEGVGPMRTRLDVSRARGFSRFVGRTDEMAALEAALERARAGNGRVVGVVADAGTGKSRLCYEFAERCRARNMQVYEAHGVAHGKAIPFLPVLEYLRNYFAIGEHDGERAAREKIAGKLLLLDRGFTESLPLLFDFLGVSDPGRPTPRADAEAQQHRLLAIMKRLVRTRSHNEASVSLVEDLHWIDGGSESFLESFVDALAGTRTLLLVNFRPEYHAAWMSKSHYQQLPLLPLGAEEITELLRELLGSDPSLNGLAERIREHTSGNPFFIEETVQALAEAGSLSGSRGAYRADTSVDKLALPASVQAVLTARIDRLGERDKQVLQSAAVIGKELSEPVLRHVADLPEAELAAGLRSLVGAELFYEEALYPEARYAFKHPLTQEVAYGSQLSGTRARRHRTAAGVIAELYEDKLDEHAALLAHHWEQAGEAHKAAEWHARAGRWAGFAAPVEALRHWHRVRELLAADATEQASSELMIEACTQTLRIGANLGLEPGEGAAVFAAGEAVAAATGNRKAHLELLARYCFYLTLAGETQRALPLLLEALPEFEEWGDIELELVGRAVLATIQQDLGQLVPALDGFEHCLRIVEANPGAADANTTAQWMGMRGWTLAYRGRVREGVEMLHKAEDLMREHQLTMGIWQGFAGILAYYAGDIESALARGQRAIDDADKTGNPMTAAVGHGLVGSALNAAGRFEEARQSLVRALELGEVRGPGTSLEPGNLLNLARSLAGLGQAERARETAAEAIAKARRGGYRLTECRAHLALAEVLLEVDGGAAADAIEAALGDCERLIEETGAKLYEPFVREQRAYLARVVGDGAAYERELREAQRLFSAIGAPGYADRIATRLGS